MLWEQILKKNAPRTPVVEHLVGYTDLTALLTWTTSLTTNLPFSPPYLNNYHWWFVMMILQQPWKFVQRIHESGRFIEFNLVQLHRIGYLSFFVTSLHGKCRSSAQHALGSSGTCCENKQGAPPRLSTADLNRNHLSNLLPTHRPTHTPLSLWVVSFSSRPG